MRHEVVAEDRGHVPRHHGVTAADVERQEEAAAAAAAGGGGEGREGGAGSAALLAAGGGQEEAWENPIEAALEAVQEVRLARVLWFLSLLLVLKFKERRSPAGIKVVCISYQKHAYHV